LAGSTPRDGSPTGPSSARWAVERYAAYSLRAWLADDRAISKRTRRFARRSAVFSFALGMAGQVAFHLMNQDRITTAP
jgi:hypothetical protein